MRHTQSFRKGSLVRKERWIIDHPVDLHENIYNFLSRQLEPTLSSFFIKDEDQILVFLVKENRIQLFYGDEDVHKPHTIFENDEDNILAGVKPFRGPDLKTFFYFVTTEIGSQLDQIYAVSKLKGKIEKFKVFTMSGGNIQSIEINQKNEMHILDTDLNLTIAKKHAQTQKFKQVEQRSLKGIERLQDFVNQLKSHQSIHMQDRTIIIRDHVFTSGPGKKYKFASDFSVTAASFDDLILRETANAMYLQCSPGSRRLCLETALYQDDIVSVHQIAPELLLLRMNRNEKEQEVNPKHFWVLMTTKGKLLDIPKSVNIILHSQLVWSRVYSHMMWDGRCRMVLEQIYDDLFEQSFVIVLTLNEKCGLLNYQKLNISGKPAQSLQLVHRTSLATPRTKKIGLLANDSLGDSAEPYEPVARDKSNLSPNNVQSLVK